MCLYTRQLIFCMEKTDKQVINKVLDNISSKEKATDVLDWFANSIEGQSYLSESMDKDFYLLEEMGVKDEMISPVDSANILSIINKTNQRKQIRTILFKVAAILIPFIFIATIGVYLNSQVGLFSNVTYSEIYVPKGETMRVLFQDGSEAYLNSDTKLRYPEKFGLRNRKVFLEGEAYFNVSSNKRRPFIVETEKNSIAVLGTSFNIYAYGDTDQIEVVLDEGKIIFYTEACNYTILPGQKIIYNKVNGSTTINNLKQALDESIWKMNILHFSNTPLYDVLRTLNKRYNIRFVIENSSALEYSYTLTSKQSTVENILLELEKIAPVNFTIKDNVVHVNL